MLEYEEFLLKSFPKAFEGHFREVDAATTCANDKARKRAINYLEIHCSPSFGFSAEGHTDRDMSKSDSVYGIPTSYDSGLLLPYIKDEGVNKFTIDSLVSVLKRSRRDSLYWNFFFDPENKNVSLFPDDVDDTSIPLMALYLSKNISLDELKTTAEKMLENKLTDPETGAIATWISGEQRTIIFDRYLISPKLCAGCLINFLWLLATIEMDTRTDVLPSFEYVDNFMDKMIINKGIDGLELPGMCYYTNRYVIFMFISRLIETSVYAEQKFGNKFIDLLKFELDLLLKKKNAEALDIACMILAISHLQLHKTGCEQKCTRSCCEITEIKHKLKKLSDCLIALQDKDGSFRAWVVYRWNRLGHWGGSKPYSTGLALAALGFIKREIL